MSSPLLRICMGCHPNVRTVFGVAVSHGYCRRHELETYRQAGIITWAERGELYVRRYWKIGIIALLAIVVLFDLSMGAEARSIDTIKAVGSRPMLAVSGLPLRQQGISAGSAGSPVLARSFRRIVAAVPTAKASRASARAGFGHQFAGSVIGVGPGAEFEAASRAIEDRVEFPTPALVLRRGR